MRRTNKGIIQYVNEICRSAFRRIRRSMRNASTTRKAHKLWDWGRRCAGQFFSRQNLIRINWIISWCICNNAYQFKVLLHLLPFRQNFKVELSPPALIWSPVCWIRVDLGSRKWYQSKCRPNIPIRLHYTHAIGLSCIVCPQYTTWQTDDRQWSQQAATAADGSAFAASQITQKR